MFKLGWAMTLCIALTSAVPLLAGEDPVAGLRSTTAPDQAKAMEAIISAGEKYIPQIEEVYSKLGDDQRDLRERCRNVVARIRAEQAKQWAEASAPGLVKTLAWDDLVRPFTWQAKLATTDDAKAALCRLTRNAKDWPEAEAVKFLKLALEDKAAAVREAAVSALDREEWKGPAVGLIVSALKDESQAVRSVAGNCLFARGDQRGLAAVLAGAASKDEKVCSLCLPAISDLIVSDPDKPQHPRFKHTPEEVVALTKLLYLEDMNARGTVMRLLGMIGDKAAGGALLDALGKEQTAKNRRRICGSLAMLRHRPAAGAMVKLVEAGLRGEKQDYGWAVAGCWAGIGDPDSVPAMIALLGNEKRSKYAAAGLSWAFGLPGRDDDYSRGEAPGEVLVPTADGTFEKSSVDKAPKPEELKKLWEEFWKNNMEKFKWSDEASTLAPPLPPSPKRP
jgi:HEAT repeat protein